MESSSYEQLAKHYESCFEKHGDTHLGVDWPKAEDVDRRYEVMLGVIGETDAPVTLLDIGCGAAHLLDHIRGRGLDHVHYLGTDISPLFIEHCRRKHPDVTFLLGDILSDSFEFPRADFAVMNGVFTERRELEFDEMFAFFKAMISKTFLSVEHGIAFNVMSKQVDYEREDLFHLPLDQMAGFVTKELSRNFVIRNDYGLYEYTTYLYKSPKV